MFVRPKVAKSRLGLVVHVRRTIGCVIYISWNMQQSVLKLGKVMALNSIVGFFGNLKLV